jgi:AraC-like DNA-binding protein
MHTILAKSVRKIVDAAVGLGAEAHDLYRAVSLDPSLLNDPDNRIPFAQLVRLYEEAARITGDRDFGLHIGEASHPRLWDVLGYSFMNSPTLGEAINPLFRYLGVWTDGATLTTHQMTGARSISRLEYHYEIDDCDPEARRQDCEKTFSVIVCAGRMVTAVDWVPVEVCFQHRAPANTSEHHRIFRSPVRFKSPANTLSIGSESMDLPLKAAEPGLCAVLDRHAEEMLASLQVRDGLIHRVRGLLRDELKGGDPGLEGVARHLAMSPRSLQRKLTDEGTSYKILLDEMRRELSMRYLQQSEVAISEVAYLLGFSEHSAFDRAFRRWAGLSPKDYRSTIRRRG